MTVAEIEVDELDPRCGEGDIVLLEVREPHEYRQAHVPGAALMPLAGKPHVTGSGQV